MGQNIRHLEKSIQMKLFLNPRALKLKIFSCTHRYAVRTLLYRPVEQEVPFRRTFDVGAVCSRFLWDSEHFIMVISQLLHHLERNIHFVVTVHHPDSYTHSHNSRPLPTLHHMMYTVHIRTETLTERELLCVCVLGRIAL